MGILARVEEDPRGAPAEAGNGETQAPKVELRPARGRTFLPEVTGVEFSGARRGYDRAEVDQFVERVSRIVVELEAMRSPDAVIERALADVGEETSAILRRARKAAEEIIADAEAHARDRSDQAETQARQSREEADHYSARVRAQAEQALDDARSEAEQVLSDARSQSEQLVSEATADGKRMREDAERYRAQVSAHIDQLAQDRHRLIDDLRKLADQFHRTADRALEQIPSHDISYEASEGNGGGTPSGTRSA